MKVIFQKALSLYLTGTTDPKSAWKADFNNCPYSKDELAEQEIDWDSHHRSFKFNDPALNLHADWESFPGYVRNAGLGIFDSLFSGIGASFAGKINFFTGAGLAGISTLISMASTLKKIPYLSTEFSLFNYGGRLLRAALHFFDSTFSTIGEKGAAFELPSIGVLAAGIFSLNRVIKEKDNKTEVPITTIGGTLGRTGIHHLESMLSSKAVKLSEKNKSLSTFLATLFTTIGLNSKEEIKSKRLPWETFEGMISQTGFHFLDSVYSGIGGTFSNSLAGLGLVTAGSLASLKKDVWNYKIPFPQIGGKLIRSVFHSFESIMFNAGSKVGNTLFGVPISLGFGLLTYLTAISKKGKNIFKNFKIPLNTVGGLVQRLPFDFIYSVMSQTGVKLARFIPAPLVVIFGPMLSFRLGEVFKKTSAKYDESHGLMIKNSIHLMESIFSSAAYKTGRMIFGGSSEPSAGSALGDGRWLTEEGRIVPTMAIGKQGKSEENQNLFSILLSSLGGVVLGILANALGKRFNHKQEVVENERVLVGAV